jgi:hypothetical protein
MIKTKEDPFSDAQKYYALILSQIDAPDMNYGVFTNYPALLQVSLNKAGLTIDALGTKEGVEANIAAANGSVVRFHARSNFTVIKEHMQKEERDAAELLMYIKSLGSLLKWGAIIKDLADRCMRE